jgi:hypothetical protein
VAVGGGGGRDRLRVAGDVAGLARTSAIGCEGRPLRRRGAGGGGGSDR